MREKLTFDDFQSSCFGKQWRIQRGCSRRPLKFYWLWVFFLSHFVSEYLEISSDSTREHIKNPQRASKALKRAVDPGRKGLRASRPWCAGAHIIFCAPPPPPPPPPMNSWIRPWKERYKQMWELQIMNSEENTTESKLHYLFMNHCIFSSFFFGSQHRKYIVKSYRSGEKKKSIFTNLWWILSSPQVILKSWDRCPKFSIIISSRFLSSLINVLPFPQELTIKLMSDWPIEDVEFVKDMNIKDSIRIDTFTGNLSTSTSNLITIFARQLRFQHVFNVFKFALEFRL